MESQRIKIRVEIRGFTTQMIVPVLPEIGDEITLYEPLINSTVRVVKRRFNQRTLQETEIIILTELI